MQDDATVASTRFNKRCVVGKASSIPWDGPGAEQPRRFVKYQNAQPECTSKSVSWASKSIKLNKNQKNELSTTIHA
jgi:hypothetical protein